MHYASITDRLAGLGSGKWQVHLRGRELRALGHPVIELTIGEPDVNPDPQLLDACETAMRAGRFRYSNGRGEPPILAALAAKYSRRTGREITSENLLYFPGTQTALYAVLMGLVEAGDKVLVPDPYYATYEGVVRAPGAEVVPVPMTAEHGFPPSPRSAGSGDRSGLPRAASEQPAQSKRGGAVARRDRGHRRGVPPARSLDRQRRGL